MKMSSAIGAALVALTAFAGLSSAADADDGFVSLTIYKAGCSPLNLYARVRFSLCTLHTRPRVQRAPGFPCALCFFGRVRSTQTSGGSRRENADAYPHRCLKCESEVSPRHCEERQRRSNPFLRKR